jgi:hypothetical protein
MAVNLLEVQTNYENLGIYNLDSEFETLKSAAMTYVSNNNDVNKQNFLSAFNAVKTHYKSLTTVTSDLQTYINKASKTFANSQLSEDRYLNKIHPEEAISSREVTRGIMPELRVRSIPYLLAISVFMASLTIFLIFQIFGFSGQINIPPSISAWLSSPASPIPFYMNPMFLGGISILLLIALIIFIGLYFKLKNTPNNK